MATLYRSATKILSRGGVLFARKSRRSRANDGREICARASMRALHDCFESSQILLHTVSSFNLDTPLVPLLP